MLTMLKPYLTRALAAFGRTNRFAATRARNIALYREAIDRRMSRLDRAEDRRCTVMSASAAALDVATDRLIDRVIAGMEEEADREHRDYIAGRILPADDDHRRAMWDEAANLPDRFEVL